MLSESQIQKIETAMRGPGPDWDPDWRLMQQLLMMITVQSKEIINLQAQIDVLSDANNASTETLIGALQQNLNDARVKANQLSPNDVQNAVHNLNTAISAAQNGQQILTIAGHTLRFVAKFIV